MDVPDLVLTKLLPSVLSGASAGLSAVLAWFKGLSSKIEGLSDRVHKLETIIGSIETRSGIAKTLQNLEEDLRSLKHYDPRAPSEREPTGKWATLSGESDWPTERKLRDFEDRLNRMELKMRSLVSEEDFDKSDRRRTEEIQTLRTALAEIKGLLQGLQSALGLINPNR